MQPKHNQFVKFLVFVLVAWLAYVVTFDTNGNFDPTTHFDVMEYRLRVAVGDPAAKAEGEIVEQNYEMQQVVNGRHDLNDGRIERDTKGK